jgi:lipopolysaccharide/colanic/teichoic acid biosynthesis glycosyltransferase
MLKRAFDFSVTVLSMPIWLPVVGAVALVVRLQLGTPVSFHQARPGLNGRIFKLVKFRSMTDERDETGALLADEARLTPFGRWLRSTSLDELPSLYNVLKGEMSLVGPRPLLVEYLPLYSATQARRHEVRPGLTGWAQVNGRNAVTWEEKFELDVWYVENRSFWLDLRVLVMTVAKVFQRAGINAQGEATMPRFLGPDRRGPDEKIGMAKR